MRPQSPSNPTTRSTIIQIIKSGHVSTPAPPVRIRNGRVCIRNGRVRIRNERGPHGGGGIDGRGGSRRGRGQTTGTSCGLRPVATRVEVLATTAIIPGVAMAEDVALILGTGAYQTLEPLRRAAAPASGRAAAAPAWRARCAGTRTARGAAPARPRRPGPPARRGESARLSESDESFKYYKLPSQVPIPPQPTPA